MCLYVLFPSSVSSTYTALQLLGAFDLSLTSLTCFNIHSIWLYGWKALSLSFPKLFADWKLVEYKESYEHKCVYVLFPSSTSSTYTALQPLGAFDLSSTSLTCFNIHSIWSYGWKALSLSFPKLFVDWKLVEYKESYDHKCVCMFFSHLQCLRHTQHYSP